MRFLLSAFLFVGSLSACNGQETYTWNQRMTVTVETPGGPVTGSTVYQMNAVVFPEGGGLAGDVAARYGHRGEAAVVDLGDGRYIFALATAARDLLYRMDNPRFTDISRMDRHLWLPLALDDPSPVPIRTEAYPRFVTFGDISDPLTADIFEADEMEAIFGAGYAIRSVTLEVVEEPMEVGRIEEVLPWLRATIPRRLDGADLEQLHPPAEFEANSLSAYSFSSEIEP